MKQTYFRELMKQWLWGFFDHFFKIVIISALWLLFSAPVLYTIFILIYSKWYNPAIYIVLINILLYSPVSLGASYYVLQIASQYASSKKFELFPKFESNSMIKINVFFKGIFKYFFPSIALILLNSIIFVFLFLNLRFYLKFLAVKIPVLGYLISGFVLWIILLCCLVQLYIIPLTLTRKISVFKIFYQSFLIVIDNIIFTVAIFVMTISFMIIIWFTVAGIFLIYYGTVSLMQFLACLNIYQQYDETMEIKKEPRTLKNIIKPWD